MNPPLVIIGGSSLVGHYLIQRLWTEGLTAEVMGRRRIDVPEGFRFTQLNLLEGRNWVAPEEATVISLLPLWILIQYLPRFIGVRSIIALGSTSRFSKADSADKDERAVAANLEMAENILQSWSLRCSVQFTILRPTMIYDGMRDRNVARIGKFIRNFHFFPVAAPGKGLRQPIHADDVAKAVIGAIGNNTVHAKALNIAGGEILPYREMVERIFAALKRKPRLLMLPTSWLRLGFCAAAKTGAIRETAFGASVFQRMNEDLIFDVEEGLKNLGYKPREFRPEIIAV